MIQTPPPPPPSRIASRSSLLIEETETEIDNVIDIEEVGDGIDTGIHVSNADSIRIDRKGWTRDYTKLMLSKAEQVVGSQWMHSYSHKRYKMMDGLLGGSMTILSFSGGFLESEQFTTMIIKYISFIVGFLAMTQQLMNFSGKSAVHKTCMNEYCDIVNTITSELAKKPEDRDEIHTFLAIIRQRMFISSKNAPDIPNKVIKAFRKQFPRARFVNHINVDLNDFAISAQTRGTRRTRIEEKKKKIKNQKEKGTKTEAVRTNAPYSLATGASPHNSSDISYRSGGGGGGQTRTERGIITPHKNRRRSFSHIRQMSFTESSVSPNALGKSIQDTIKAKTFTLSPPMNYQLEQLKRESNT
jgi:hypothetical protein